jgi:hypothetical protein
MSGDLDALRRELVVTVTETDSYADELLRQVVALEELAMIPWPRSILARRRYRRELRRSVAHIEGTTFAEKRINSIGTGWLGRPR